MTNVQTYCAQVILSSEGFSGAKDLASKIVSMFTLSNQLLSTQQHYDWGLRALKAVLNTGGKLIQVTDYPIFRLPLHYVHENITQSHPRVYHLFL